MSKMKFVRFRGNQIFAFDVVSDVFVKHLFDAATSYLENSSDPWLSDVANRWRLDAGMPDFGLLMDDDWSADQVETFLTLANAACDTLSKREEIYAEEIESREFREGLRSSARGLPLVKTAAAIRFGQAIVKLVRGALPKPPPGTRWYFGRDGNPTTMPSRELQATFGEAKEQWRVNPLLTGHEIGPLSVQARLAKDTAHTGRPVVSVMAQYGWISPAARIRLWLKSVPAASRSEH